MSTVAPRFWLLLAVPILAIVLAAEISWIFDHPYGIHWDEAAYINQVSIDARALRSGDPMTIAREIVYSDPARPPAYRFVGTPAVAVFGSRPAACRLLSLAVFAIAVVLLYRTVRLLSGPAAAVFSVLFLCLSPDVVAATVFFGTEPPLYLATSAMLWILVRCWSTGSERTLDWIGLGIALALGFLSKASFVALAAPVMLLTLSVRPLGLARGPSARWLLQAGALGGVIAAPWWAENLGSAAAFSAGARDFVRHSLGHPSFQTFERWTDAFAEGSVGPALGALALLVVVAFAARSWRADRPLLTSVQRVALLACVCVGLPIVLIQLSGTNHLLRHVSPALIPLSIAIGVLADSSGWLRRRATAGIAAAAFAIQAAMIAYPVVHPNARFVDTGLVTGTLPWRALMRFDQWNWDSLRDLARERGLQHPLMTYLGSGRTLNGASIVYPWVSRGEEGEHATWLWHYEQGPVDWSDVLERAAHSDLVVTAPQYVGDPLDKQDLDNANNAEFETRLEADHRFSGPFRLTMGRFEPVEVDVFVTSQPDGAAEAGSVPRHPG